MSGVLTTRISFATSFFALIILCVLLYASINSSLSEQSARHTPNPVDSGQVVPHNAPQHNWVSTEKSDQNGSTMPPVPQGSINIANGRISVNLEAYSLLAALNEVSHRSGVPIITDIQDRQISVQANDVPLEQGIQQLAQGFDLFFFHDGATGALKSAWAYESGKGNFIAPVPAELWMTNREIQRRLTSTDPEQRARVAEMLVDSGGAQAMHWVLQAVRDPTDVVRYRTLQKIKDAGLSLPQDILREILSNDPSPLARFIALDIVFATMAGLDPIATQQLVEVALNDKDLPVSNHARDMLFAMQGKGSGENGVR